MLQNPASESVEDDVPVVVSFKELKKNKFVFLNNLKNDLKIAQRNLSKRNHFRDPRFDPRVNGVCVMDDWKFLKNEQANTIKTLKRQLKFAKSEGQRTKIKQVLTLLHQRQATEKDVSLRRSVKKQLSSKQISHLKSGKRPSFLTRGQLRSKIEEERLRLSSKREKAKYLARQTKKRKGAVSL